MEILFRAQPHAALLSLSDSLAQQPWETLAALLCTIRDATLEPLDDDKRSRTADLLQALIIQESFFRPRLQEFSHFQPTAKEAEVIFSAAQGLYEIHHIEGLFYKYGGLNGILALAAVFKHTDSVYTRWAAIGEEGRRFLAQNVADMFSVQQNKWRDELEQRTGFEPRSNRLQFLGRHYVRQRPNHASQASSAPFTHTAPAELRRYRGIQRRGSDILEWASGGDLDSQEGGPLHRILEPKLDSNSSDKEITAKFTRPFLSLGSTAPGTSQSLLYGQNSDTPGKADIGETADKGGKETATD
jgi:hypothetical protein